MASEPSSVLMPGPRDPNVNNNNNNNNNVYDINYWIQSGKFVHPNLVKLIELGGAKIKTVNISIITITKGNIQC